MVKFLWASLTLGLLLAISSMALAVDEETVQQIQNDATYSASVN